jgi:hypothetical protein
MMYVAGFAVMLVTQLAFAQSAPEPAQTHCYAGTSRVVAPDGTLLIELPVYLWRSLDPAASQIIERVIMSD